MEFARHRSRLPPIVLHGAVRSFDHNIEWLPAQKQCETGAVLIIRRLFRKLYFGLFLLLVRYPKFIKIALELPDLGGSPGVDCERNNAESNWFLCAKNIDRLRYLPQRKTVFNPGALPVGFVKETYQNMEFHRSSTGIHTPISPADEIKFPQGRIISRIRLRGN